MSITMSKKSRMPSKDQSINITEGAERNAKDKEFVYSLNLEVMELDSRGDSQSY